MSAEDRLEEYNCGLLRVCGGCFFSDKSYDEELRLKEERVSKLLAPFVGTDTVMEGIIASPAPIRYRNKMEYSFGDAMKGGPLTLGLHRKKSFYDVIDICDCRLVHEDFNHVVRAAGDYFRGHGAGYYHKRTHRGYLRHLMVRRAVHTGEILVDLVTSSQMEGESESELLQGFTDSLLTLGRKGVLAGSITAIMHTTNDSLSDAIRDEGTTVLFGSDHIREELLGLNFRITPFSFFQTNTLAAEVLYGKVREYAQLAGIGKDMTIYDLYSGTGTIAQILAKVAGEVIGVEIVEEAVISARESAVTNGLANVRFIADDVLTALDHLQVPDMVILDPPRDGVHPGALKIIISYGVPYMIYVSCKPESLARDLTVLCDAGYRLVRAVALDQFPRTDNVETVALLTRLFG